MAEPLLSMVYSYETVTSIKTVILHPNNVQMGKARYDYDLSRHQSSASGSTTTLA